MIIRNLAILILVISVMIGIIRCSSGTKNEPLMDFELEPKVSFPEYVYKGKAYENLDDFISTYDNDSRSFSKSHNKKNPLKTMRFGKRHVQEHLGLSKIRCALVDGLGPKSCVGNLILEKADSNVMGDVHGIVWNVSLSIEQLKDNNRDDIICYPNLNCIISFNGSCEHPDDYKSKIKMNTKVYFNTSSADSQLCSTQQQKPHCTACTRLNFYEVPIWNTQTGETPTLIKVDANDNQLMAYYEKSLESNLIKKRDNLNKINNVPINSFQAHMSLYLMSKKSNNVMDRICYMVNGNPPFHIMLKFGKYVITDKSTLNNQCYDIPNELTEYTGIWEGLMYDTVKSNLQDGYPNMVSSSINYISKKVCKTESCIVCHSSLDFMSCMDYTKNSSILIILICSVISSTSMLIIAFFQVKRLIPKTKEIMSNIKDLEFVYYLREKMKSCCSKRKSSERFLEEPKHDVDDANELDDLISKENSNTNKSKVSPISEKDRLLMERSWKIHSMSNKAFDEYMDQLSEIEIRNLNNDLKIISLKHNDSYLREAHLRVYDFLVKTLKEKVKKNPIYRFQSINDPSWLNRDEISRVLTNSHLSDKKIFSKNSTMIGKVSDKQVMIEEIMMNSKFNAESPLLNFLLDSPNRPFFTLTNLEKYKSQIKTSLENTNDFYFLCTIPRNWQCNGYLKLCDGIFLHLDSDTIMNIGKMEIPFRFVLLILLFLPILVLGQCVNSPIVSSDLTECSTSGSNKVCKIKIESNFKLLGLNQPACLKFSDGNQNLLKVNINMISVYSKYSCTRSYHTCSLNVVTSVVRRCYDAGNCPQTCVEYPDNLKDDLGELSSISAFNDKSYFSGCVRGDSGFPGCLIPDDACLYFKSSFKCQNTLIKISKIELLDIIGCFQIDVLKNTVSDRYTVCSSLSSPKINFPGASLTFIGSFENTFEDLSNQCLATVISPGSGLIAADNYITRCNPAGSLVSPSLGDVQISGSDLDSIDVEQKSFSYSRNPGDKSSLIISSKLYDLSNLKKERKIIDNSNDGCSIDSHGFLNCYHSKSASTEWSLSTNENMTVTETITIVCPVVDLVSGMKGYYDSDIASQFNLETHSTCSEGYCSLDCGQTIQIKNITLFLDKEVKKSTINFLSEMKVVYANCVITCPNNYSTTFVLSGSLMDPPKISPDLDKEDYKAEFEVSSNSSISWMKKWFLGADSWWHYLIMALIVSFVVIMTVALVRVAMRKSSNSKKEKKM